jgi:hypothetical protein
VHLQFIDPDQSDFDKPTLATQHGNSKVGATLPRNTVFISANHAARHGAACAVLNGLDWDEYAPFEATEREPYFHFLGKAAWRVKNVQGAIDVALHANVPLVVMGGHRLNIKRGFRLTLSRRISFLGMVGGEEKFSVMRRSILLIAACCRPMARYWRKRSVRAASTPQRVMHSCVSASAPPAWPPIICRSTKR